MQDRVDYRTCTAAALDIPGAVVNAAQALRDLFTASGVLDAPVFFYRSRSGACTARMSRGALLRELRNHILAPAGVPDWQLYTLRSLRPGGATDLASAGVPDTVIKKLGKWSSEAGIVPYNRVDHHLLRDLSVYQRAMMSLQ